MAFPPAAGTARAGGGSALGPPVLARCPPGLPGPSGPRPLVPLWPGGLGSAGRTGLSQSKWGDCKAPRSSAVPEGDSSHGLTLAPVSDGHGGLIQPRKVPNPVRESRRHRELHRELLFSHGRGILPRHVAELPRALESRRLRQRRQEEPRGPASDLEQQLRKRQQRLEEHERQAALSREPERRPEFLRVRESLRRMELAPATGARQT